MIGIIEAAWHVADVGVACLEFSNDMLVYIRPSSEEQLVEQASHPINSLAFIQSTFQGEEGARTKEVACGCVCIALSSHVRLDQMLKVCGIGSIRKCAFLLWIVFCFFVLFWRHRGLSPYTSVVHSWHYMGVTGRKFVSLAGIL